MCVSSQQALALPLHALLSLLRVPALIMPCPPAPQMFFRATLFSAFGASKRWLGTNADGTTRDLTTADYYKAGFITGAAAAFTEAPIDFYKSQIQVQMVRAKADPTYKGEQGAVLSA